MTWALKICFESYWLGSCLLALTKRAKNAAESNCVSLLCMYMSTLPPTPPNPINNQQHCTHTIVYVNSTQPTTNNQPTSFLQELRSNFELKKSWHFVIYRGSWFNLSFQRLQLFCSLSLLTTKSISNLLTATEDGHLRLALLCLLSSQDLRRQKTGISDRRLPPLTSPSYHQCWGSGWWVISTSPPRSLGYNPWDLIFQLQINVVIHTYTPGPW